MWVASPLGSRVWFGGGGGDRGSPSGTYLSRVVTFFCFVEVIYPKGQVPLRMPLKHKRCRGTRDAELLGAFNRFNPRRSLLMNLLHEGARRSSTQSQPKP